ncbi:Gmad2 immunoglobulin-like domain-containing protein [Nocardioides marmoribigeumensis]|uniref:GerMN domain-containing protein n=1 Tax=Nocardioides marmoribigeumensis TaxID=433649 RepID=A0ABU2C0S6_9ACTN|nr:Gmad2 immunoglobulin-like domain-containing protein [Nocardioides marmoribigeumensis]MDR7364282.1 hypothetical protein [Nocardioides marmoribigeumensis]
MTGDRTPDERRISDALHDTVDDLEPVHGLSAIRSRLQEDAMSSPSRPASRTALLALGGAAAVAVVVTGVVLVTQQSDRPSSDPPPAASSSLPPSPADSPSDSPSGDDSSSPSDGQSRPHTTPPPTATSRALPVYYVGTTPVGPRLYREFHRTQVAAGDELVTALRQAVEVAPLDPDYRTPWPSGTRVDVVPPSGPDQVTISLSGPTPGSLHDRPAGMSRAEARMAVQQLVYTAQAAVQSRVPVQLLLDGRHTDQVMGVPASEPLANDDETSTSASVWITSPQDGDTVRAGGVEVTGRGAFFEATVAWQLLSPDGHVVADGAGMAQECCTLSPYSFTIPKVQPGDYVIRVYDADMSGGESGRKEPEDTKRITVG